MLGADRRQPTAEHVGHLMTSSFKTPVTHQRATHDAPGTLTCTSPAQSRAPDHRDRSCIHRPSVLCHQPRQTHLLDAETAPWAYGERRHSGHEKVVLMLNDGPPDAWSDGDAYEAYVGRWSRLVARDFLAWLAPGDGLRWLDVGAGTGALSAAAAAAVNPREVVGVDTSRRYVDDARRRVADPRVRFEQGDACALPYDGLFDAVVSGLMLNFVPDARSAVDSMTRAATPGGLVAAYVWDYAGRMEFMRAFWDAAAVVDASARDLDEGRRFPLCDPDRLAELWRAAGLQSVETTALEVATRFRDVDDFWAPFLGGQGPAPAYLMSLPKPQRAAVRDAVRSSLPIAGDGSISMIARAWAVKGHTPPSAAWRPGPG
jgi:SAM-dependent methyltransferase